MDDPAFVPLGRVVKVHGLKGEVSVIPAAGLPFVVAEGLHVWFVPPPAGVRSGVVEWVRSGPKGPLVKVSGIDDIDTATTLVGTSISCRFEDAPEAEDVFDPIGVEVSDTQRGPLGRIADVIVTGANDVWVVEGGPYGQVLLPVIDEVVLHLDEEARTAAVHLLPGLLEDE